MRPPFTPRVPVPVATRARADDVDASPHPVRRAGTHTLGLFVSHYAVNWALRTTGTTGGMETGPAVVTAMVVTLVLCVIAPHVPRPPWSPRTGRRRSRGPRGPSPGDLSGREPSDRSPQPAVRGEPVA